MWFSSLWLFACEEGLTPSKGWKVRTGSSSHSIEPRLHGQALAAVLNETCIGELNFSREDPYRDARMDDATVQAWCCKSLTVPASPERCKVQVLAKASETNSHVTHLNLEDCEIEAKGIKVRSLVWDPVSGVEAWGDYIRLYKYDGFSRLFWSTASIYSSAVARSMLDSGWHWLAQTWSFEDQKKSEWNARCGWFGICCGRILHLFLLKFMTTRLPSV